MCLAQGNENYLKRHNQAKIIKKSVFLFWIPNMAIRSEYVHRLELRSSFEFWVAVAFISVFLILDMSV